MPWIAPVAGGVAALAGGILGANATNNAAKQAGKQQQAAMDLLSRVDIPKEEKLRIIYESPQLMGLLTERPEIAEQLGISAQELVQVDPRLRQAQMGALESLSKMGETPFSATESAKLNSMRRENDQNETSRQNQILQEMARRGAAGSGVEIANRLASSQSNANRASQESDSLAAMAQERMLNALSKGGSLAGDIRTQEGAEQSKLAASRDAVTDFNLRQRADINNRNIMNQRAVEASNLAARQSQEDTRVGNRNKTKESAADAIKAVTTYKLNKAGSTATQANAMAATSMERAGQIGKMYGDIASGVSKAAYGALSDDKDKDKDKS